MSTDYRKKGFGDIVGSLLDDLGTGLGGRTAITDTTDGSVVRTLAEAFARELAVAYASLDQVYQLGYVDTATGSALDNVVALLGVTRRRRGSLEGTVTFSRAEPAPQPIAIPAGTQVTGLKQPLCETTITVEIGEGQREVTAPVRSVAMAEKPLVEPGAITMLARAILGVEAVTNRIALIVRAGEEADDELRARAKQAVQIGNRGTRTALETALRALGLRQVDVVEPRDRPGVVEILIGDAEYGRDEDLRARVADVIEETRPAGILVLYGDATPVVVAVEATVVLREDLGDKQRASVEAELVRAVQTYVGGLGTGENVRDGKVRNLLLSHDLVEEVSTGPILQAWMTRGGRLENTGTARRLPGNDLRVEAKERAQLGAPIGDYRPFRLALQPPAPSVFLDVELVVRAGGSIAVDDVRASLESFLHGETFVDGVTYQKLAATFTPAQTAACSGMRFTLVHEVDGRAIDLLARGDDDHLEPRERVRLRNVVLHQGRA